MSEVAAPCTLCRRVETFEQVVNQHAISRVAWAVESNRLRQRRLRPSPEVRLALQFAAKFHSGSCSELGTLYRETRLAASNVRRLLRSLKSQTLWL